MPCLDFCQGPIFTSHSLKPLDALHDTAKYSDSIQALLIPEDRTFLSDEVKFFEGKTGISYLSPL